MTVTVVDCTTSRDAGARGRLPALQVIVETHRANLMQKLNLHNIAEIVHYAVRKRVIV